jgi:hypothetical protein
LNNDDATPTTDPTNRFITQSIAERQPVAKTSRQAGKGAE